MLIYQSSADLDWKILLVKSLSFKGKVRGWYNRLFSYSEKTSQSNDTLLYFVEFPMCTILIEALTPLDRTSRIKMYKNNARSRLFSRIAKRSINDEIQEILL